MIVFYSIVLYMHKYGMCLENTYNPALAPFKNMCQKKG